MKRIKMLEIGAEGGSMGFYRVEQDGEISYEAGFSGKLFSSASEVFQSYSKSKGELLRYYPVEINDDFIDELMTVLQLEINQYDRDEFPCINDWEEKLNQKLKPKRNKCIQTFIIYHVEMVKTFSYNEFAEYRILDSETLEYNYNPNSKKLIDGIGSIEGNTFIIRDEDSNLKGIFPLERFEVYVNGNR